MNLTLTRSQYDALIEAGLDADTEEIYRLRRIIDGDNNITRYILQIRWQDVGGQPPPRIELGKGWPQAQTYKLEMERPIERADVDTVLQQVAVNPVDVQVTADPEANVGWFLLNDYDFTA